MGDKVFISYRREDSAADAGRLYGDLVREFGSERVFTDIDNIPLGGSVERQISDAIRSAAVVLVLIGPNWRPERLSTPNDWVRIEIGSAIEQVVPIIPIRLRRAEMPDASQLPQEVAKLTDCNAAEIEHSSWRRDLIPIIDAIRLHLAGTTVPPTLNEGRPSQQRTPAATNLTLAISGATVSAILIVLVAIAVFRQPQQSPATSNAASSEAPEPTEAPAAASSQENTSVSSVDGSASTQGIAGAELIPITLDGPLVGVTSPAELTDEGFVFFPESGAGEATIRFEAATSDKYVIWARIRISPEATEPVDSNSLYVVEGESLTRSDQYVWDFWENKAFPTTAVWEWDRVSRRGVSGTAAEHADNPFTATGRIGGTTIVTLGGRETGVAVERIILTNDVGWQPPECETSPVCASRTITSVEIAND